MIDRAYDVLNEIVLIEGVRMYEYEETILITKPITILDYKIYTYFLPPLGPPVLEPCFDL